MSTAFARGTLRQPHNAAERKHRIAAWRGNRQSWEGGGLANQTDPPLHCVNEAGSATRRVALHAE